VCLVFADGLTLEDDSEHGIALFITEAAVAMPATVALYPRSLPPDGRKPSILSIRQGRSLLRSLAMVFKTAPAERKVSTNYPHRD
jgi:hypothetical protein